MIESHVNDISLSFKTTDDDGLLLMTSNDANDDYLQLYLDNGRAVIETNIDPQPSVSIHYSI